MSMNLFRQPKKNSKAIDIANRAKEAERQKALEEHQERVDSVVNKITQILVDEHITMGELPNVVKAVLMKVDKVEKKVVIRDLFPDMPPSSENTTAEDDTAAKRAADKVLAEGKK